MCINNCIRFVMKKMNKEFEELMFTKTEGRMIEQLTVGRGYNVKNGHFWECPD